MPIYIYQATDPKGNIQRGELNFPTKKEVIDYLSREGLIPISIEAKGEIKGLKSKIGRPFERISIVDQIMLTKHLSAIIKAGISLREATEILIADAKKPIMKKILSQIKFNLEKGQPLSATFEYFRHFFSPVFIGMIKAGELSGNLENTLSQLGDHLTREDNLRRKIKSAMIYPAILLFAASGVIILLLVFVLPRLTEAFGQGGIELPWTAKILVKTSQILTANFHLILGILFFLSSFLFFFRKTTLGSIFFGKIFDKIPIIRDLIKKTVLTRLSRTLSVLISSGVPILESLDITSQAVGNENYKKVLLETKKDVQKGMALNFSFRKSPQLYPEHLLGMMKVGEETGSLEKTLETAANFYEEETDRTLKNLVSLLEPALLIIMGIIIGGIAISVLLPIYQAISGLK